MFRFTLTKNQKEEMRKTFEEAQTTPSLNNGNNGAICAVLQCWDTGTVKGEFVPVDVAVAIRILLDTVREEEE